MLIGPPHQQCGGAPSCFFFTLSRSHRCGLRMGCQYSEAKKPTRFLMGLMSLLWMIYGYSMAFGEGNAFCGNPMQYFMLQGVGAAPNADYAATVPHQSFTAKIVLSSSSRESQVSGEMSGGSPTAARDRRSSADWSASRFSKTACAFCSTFSNVLAASSSSVWSVNRLCNTDKASCNVASSVLATVTSIKVITSPSRRHSSTGSRPRRNSSLRRVPGRITVCDGHESPLLEYLKQECDRACMG